MKTKSKDMKRKAAIFLAVFMVSAIWLHRESVRAGSLANVTPAEAGVYFEQAAITMTPATVQKLVLIGAQASEVKWSIDNQKAAVISSNGKITAKAKGTAVVTAVYRQQEYPCTVNVVYGTYETPDGMQYQDVKGGFGYTGRWFKKSIGGGKNYFTNTDGSAVYFKVTGSKYVTVNFASNTSRGTPYFAYSVDGGKMKRQLISKTKINVGGSGKTHYVRLLIDAMSEYENRWGGAGTAVKSVKPVTKGGIVTAIKPQNDVIAFYGDSITKGVRTLGMETPSGASAVNSFSWHCANKLKMVPYFAGFASAGIFETGTASNCRSTIERFAASKKASAFKASVIVLEHGTNDVSVGGSTYVKEYKKVLNLLHKKNPQAIVMAMIPLNQIHADDIRNAASSYSWCHVVETSSLAPRLGSFDNIHPNAAGSKAMGEYLAKQIMAAREQ